jgi:DNA-binding SARP family transcriptional activator/tetratricopeptide (TPR) repeat protein
MTDEQRDESGGVRFGVLGPVEVLAAGQGLPGLAPRHRAVLGYLLLHAGTVVSPDRLTGAMWGDEPPDTARAQVHAAVTAIRKVLREAGATQALATQPGGYVITPEPGALDLDEFGRRLDSAKAEAAAGDREGATGLLRATLALWQGEPLAGVRAAYAPGARARLVDRRLAAVELLAELELSLGRAEGLCGELAAEAAAHPSRERLSRQLMLALYRAGRQADALAAARTFRAALADEQGLDPSRAFTALEQAVLCGDPGLDQPAPAPAEPSREPAEPVRRGPRQANFLPYDTVDFAGREAELDQLTGWLPADRGIVAIWAINGMAGIGKTALAVHTAHKLADRFPDGQLFADLRAHTPDQPPLEPGAALGSLLRQLGVPAERIPAAVTDRAALWRAELAGRRVLAVLDNAADVSQLRPLLPGATDSLILITSRRRLTSLDGVRALTVDSLPAGDAVRLFSQIVGDRAAAAPIAVLDVLQQCGFLPLAVRIAAARLLHRPRWSVEYLADRLRDQRRRLAELSTAERGIGAALALSYQQLSPAQQRMFRLLSLLPGRDADVGGAAALAGAGAEAAEVLLEELLDAHVLAQQEAGRYTFHDLVRQYARAVAATDEPAAAQRQALTRLLDHYLRTTAAASDLIYPDVRYRRPPLPRPATPLATFSGTAEATAWLHAERANLIAAAAYAADRDWPAHTSQLAMMLERYLDVHAYHTDAIYLHTCALHASRRCGDEAGEAHALIVLDVMNSRLGRYQPAGQRYQHDVELLRETGDRYGEAQALNMLGEERRRQRDHEQAQRYYLASLNLYGELGDRFGEAIVLGNLGIVEARQGHCEAGEAHIREALRLHRTIGCQGGEATQLGNLGLVRELQGQLTQAGGQYRQALDLYRELGYGSGEAEMLNCLAEIAQSEGATAQAERGHTAALALATEAGNPPEQARAHHGLARVCREDGHTDLAREHAREALELYSRLSVPEAGEVADLITRLGR